MGQGIAAVLVLGGIALSFITFRSGLALYKKILGWLTLAGLVYFYQAELWSAYKQFSAGDYRTLGKEFATVLQISLPALAFVLFWIAFLVSSAMDAGRILIILFVLFMVSAAAKIAFLI